MSYVKTDAPAAASQNKDQTKTEPQRSTRTTLQCLVVSVSKSRREMLSRAATEAGWNASVCADAGNAQSEFERSLFQFALIDLEGNGRGVPEGMCDLCERISAAGGRLLAICGHDGDAKEEIWARQLGTWLYLPGVVDGDDVAMLCSEARQIVQQNVAARTNAGRQRAAGA